MTGMSRKSRAAILAVGIWAMFQSACFAAPGGAPPPTISPAAMARVGTVDERFQSYNIEMVEVTGGRFWKPFDKQVDAILASQAAARQAGQSQPVGMDPNLYQYRPPIDLANPRLRKLAAALGPAYVRVSGTWANSTYFQNSGDAAPAKPPTGFNGVLTRQQWKGVVDFSNAVNAKIVTSFATSAGTRDAAGVWTPAQATELLAYTKSVGGIIAAAEYMNEPTYAEMGGAPKGYDAAAYARDFAVFRPFMKKSAPGVVILGPGGVGEGISLGSGPMRMLRSEDILAATGPAFDAFSYHFYGTVSSRCATAMGPRAGTTTDAALSEQWLTRTDTVEAFYGALRDRFLPGKPIWNTETAQAACGGDWWAATFIDSFRYLNQLGTLARHGVQVVAHNTLAASDYALLDGKTLNPRPNYWAALLWRKLMGTVVLDPGASPAPSLHLYAHCLRGEAGGVAVLVINADRAASQSLRIPVAAQRYTLTAQDLLKSDVQLNGSELKLGADDALPPLTGLQAPSGDLTFEPASITFLAIPGANNASCR